MGFEQGRMCGRDLRWTALVALNAAYASVLVFLAVSPLIPGVANAPDHLAHAAAYGVQAILIFALLARSWQPGPALAASWLGATAFGCLTEGLQMLQPRRSAELLDIVADACGAFAACVVIAALSSRRREKDGKE